ncbi:hypothetical protein PR048_009577 [Dryococelus australis]|uniref:Uncharacterized protein n=1 Tax=Dryococelus australis TaxID=614101 RepID=A0ABQ9I0C4_9NEOP|nr:hypothetical protein PR048_009577 [Dryococelus australis]
MDRLDSRILQDWLEIHYPFQHEHNLHPLSCGISAESRVNCDNVQAIGETVLQAIVGKTFAEAKISRKARINSLSRKSAFHAAVFIMKSGKEKTEYLKYELSPQPPALFDGPHMMVVFDGYSGKPGTKTQEQAQRAMRWPCPDIVFGEQTMATTLQEDVLMEVGDGVFQVKDDADVLVVTIALDIGLSGNPDILVGTDAELLVMLIYRNRPNGYVKMLHPSTNKTSAKLYDIVAIQKDIGDMQSAVLFAHAVTREVIKIFNSSAPHPEELANTGERFVRALYPGRDKFDNIVNNTTTPVQSYSF